MTQNEEHSISLEPTHVIHVYDIYVYYICEISVLQVFHTCSTGVWITCVILKYHTYKCHIFNTPEAYLVVYHSTDATSSYRIKHFTGFDKNFFN